MKAGLILTHLAALVVGMVLASGGAREKPTRPGPEVATEPGNGITKTQVRPKAASHERQLASLAGIPGDPDHLRQLRAEIIREWAATKPLEALDYLGSRPWDPYAGGTPGWLRQLAREHPDALLDYAIRSGCRTSLSCLATEGDPHQALFRFLALGEARLPPEIIQELFKHAAGMDPDFHHELGRLETLALRKAAAQSIADSLLATHRFDDLIELLAELPAGEVHETMVAAIVDGFSDTYAATAFLLDLPAESRDLAIDGLLSEVEFAPFGSADSDKQFHELITLLQAHGLDQGRESSIAASIAEGAYGVSNHFIDEDADRGEVADRWTAWARSLPGDTAWQSAKLAAYQRATTASPDRWQELLEIPEPAIRDLALASCVDIVDRDVFPEVAARIEDESLRTITLDYVEWEAEDWNPFGPTDEYPEELPWRIATAEESEP